MHSSHISVDLRCDTVLAGCGANLTVMETQWQNCVNQKDDTVRKVSDSQEGLGLFLHQLILMETNNIPKELLQYLPRLAPRLVAFPVDTPDKIPQIHTLLQQVDPGEQSTGNCGRHMPHVEPEGLKLVS
jgi:hypothetical protein